jgi:hypothetical protein
VTEANQVNGAIARHLGPLGKFRRLEVPGARGWPDWHWAARRGEACASGWIEAKLLDGRERPLKLTAEQVMFGEDEVAAGGRWVLLGLNPSRRAWLAFDPAGARALFDGVEPTPLVVATGAFPTVELWRAMWL